MPGEDSTEWMYCVSCWIRRRSWAMGYPVSRLQLHLLTILKFISQSLGLRSSKLAEGFLTFCDLLKNTTSQSEF